MTNLGLLKCANSFTDRFRNTFNKSDIVNKPKRNQYQYGLEAQVSEYNPLDNVSKPVFFRRPVTSPTINPQHLTNFPEEAKSRAEDFMTNLDTNQLGYDPEIHSLPHRSSPEAGYWEQHKPSDIVKQYYRDNWERALNSAKQYRQNNPLSGLRGPDDFESRLHTNVPVYRNLHKDQKTDYYHRHDNYASVISPELFTPIVIEEDTTRSPRWAQQWAQQNGLPNIGSALNLHPDSILEHELGHHMYPININNWEELLDRNESLTYIPGFKVYDEDIGVTVRSSPPPPTNYIIPIDNRNYFDKRTEFKQGLARFKREHYNSTGHLIDSPEEFDKTLKFYLSDDPETFEKNIQHLTPEGQRWLRQYKRYEDMNYRTGRNAYREQGRLLAPGLVHNRNQQMLNTSKYFA